MVLEKQEADHAMSWLSTLGGAFSALGEEFEHCVSCSCLFCTDMSNYVIYFNFVFLIQAKMAGKISIRQFELALRLDNPLLIARCRLYSALSLIQCGYFRMPRYIIKNTYRFALEEKDERLQNMCHGIWAKLQYCRKQYKEQKKHTSSKASYASSKVWSI